MASDFTKWEEVKLDTNERDCEHCVHYKEYKDGLYSCEKWECEYERRENNDGSDA